MRKIREKASFKILTGDMFLEPPPCPHSCANDPPIFSWRRSCCRRTCRLAGDCSALSPRNDPFCHAGRWHEQSLCSVQGDDCVRFRIDRRLGGAWSYVTSTHGKALEPDQNELNQNSEIAKNLRDCESQCRRRYANTQIIHLKTMTDVVVAPHQWGAALSWRLGLWALCVLD